ncbi:MULTISPECIES: EAL domain-containing protein [Marinobacter]|uniref:EAL domain-containing protein n=1 Tax=Marinobacter TaxID=2742 RepID=UPI001D088253|nr:MULTISPECIES: EAL domain-containing protein [Marinobacter]MCG8518001.1 EAL domain-containing protein [Pseudomonadales bacterium]MCK7568531.1 EAL domain-containing protein [Marinobacter xestospongiae]UDL06533.1 EAL domain-containing protein [Marinobacter sp. CA1]
MSKFLPDQLASTENDLIDSLLTQGSEGWTASYQGLTLKTALQPIFSISHKRIIGYEALVRAFDNDAASVLPIHLFQLPRDAAENLFLDRLCRHLHVQNYSQLSDSLNWLFLNVSPRVVATGRQHDSFFGNLLRKTGLPAHRVVMEIVEQPTDDAEQLRETVSYYQQLGCLTAIDDFGAGHSNFERIWNLSPDIVKLDRTLITRATDDRKARQILNGIVSLLHQSGCLVLLEGVETHEQAMIAIDAGVDFVQGYYFSHPSTELPSIASKAPDFETLLADYKSRKQLQLDPSQQIVSFFSDYFLTAITLLKQGSTLDRSCQSLLEHPAVSRCYLIDTNGVQLQDTVVAADSRYQVDPRFQPLENTESADWFRQNYLKDALAQPNILQVTSPYLSVTGAHMCVTLSLAYNHHGRIQVLCCDLLANRMEHLSSSL